MRSMSIPCEQYMQTCQASKMLATQLKLQLQRTAWSVSDGVPFRLSRMDGRCMQLWHLATMTVLIPAMLISIRIQERRKCCMPFFGPIVWVSPRVMFPNSKLAVPNAQPAHAGSHPCDPLGGGRRALGVAGMRRVASALKPCRFSRSQLRVVWHGVGRLVDLVINLARTCTTTDHHTTTPPLCQIINDVPDPQEDPH